MKTNAIKLFFYIFLTIIPLLALFRACQITDSDQYQQQGHLLILPSENKVSACIRFDSEADKKRGAYVLMESSSNIRIRETGEEWKTPLNEQHLVDRTIIDFGGKYYQFRQYPSDYQWKQFCNIPITNMGIENRSSPIYISFNPQSRDDRIVLNDNDIRSALTASLKQKNMPSVNSVRSLLLKLQDIYKKLPYPIDQHKTILVNDLLVYLPEFVQKKWSNATTPEEGKTILDNALVQVIFEKKQLLAQTLMSFMPSHLKNIFDQETLSIKQAKAFRKWIKTHCHGQVGVSVRRLKIEDIFLVIDILSDLNSNQTPHRVVHDRYQWSVLERLSPRISDKTMAIRKWLFITSHLKQLKRADTNKKKNNVILRALSHLNLDDYQKWTEDERQLINDWLIHRALKTGRIAKITPPKDYPVFLSSVDKGWRLYSFVPGLIRIQRMTEKAGLKWLIPGIFQPVVIQNGDQIHAGNQVFSFELRPVAQTVSRQLNKKDFRQLGLKNPGTRAIIHESTGLSHLSLILNSFDKLESSEKIIKACLKNIPDDISFSSDDNKNEREQHTWELVKNKNNRLVSPRSLYGVFNPSGYIPDKYHIAHYSELLKDIQQAGLLYRIDGFLYMPDTELLNHIRNSTTHTHIAYHMPVTKALLQNIKNADELTFQSWIKLLKKVEKSSAVASSIRSVNLAFRPAGFSFDAQIAGNRITSDPSWSWYENENWHSASLRYDLCPIPYKNIRKSWVWDMHPWKPESKEVIGRVFQKKFLVGSKIISLIPELSVITSGKVLLQFNGKKIPLVSSDGQEKNIKLWRLLKPGKLLELIQWGKENTIQLLITNHPPKRTIANYVGLQVILSRSNTSQDHIIKTDMHWQTNDAYYFRWQDQDSKNWKPVITQAPYLMEPGLEDIPVIWCQESEPWTLYTNRNCNRYFRRKFDWPGGNALIRVSAIDPVRVYLNGKHLQLSNGGAFIPDGMLYKHKKNILAIAVENRFSQPLTNQNSPNLYISAKTGQVCMSAYSFIQNNLYDKRLQDNLRGQIVDRDQRSLPKLRLIDGSDRLIHKGHEIPLARTIEQNEYIKDILFIIHPKQNINLIDLPGPYKNQFLRLMWSSKSHHIQLIDKCGGRMPDQNYYFLYSVFKKYPFKNKFWEPEDPSDFVDLPPIKINITNVPQHILKYDRAQIPLKIRHKGRMDEHIQKSISYTHFYPPNPLTTEPDIDQDGISPSFKLGELLIFDLSSIAYHALEIDGYQKLAYTKRQDPIFNTPAIRFKRNKDNTITLIAIGEFTSTYTLTVNNQAVSEKGYTLQDGDEIQTGNYRFEFISDNKGLLAGNVMINGKPGRYYPPGLGLSHTVGVNFPHYQNGLERVMDGILSGKWSSQIDASPPNVQLTLDDDLCRIVRDEVNRQLKIIDRRYAYHKKSLKNLLNQSDTPVQKEFYTSQINTIEKSRQRFGMLVILNENSEILAASSEPSLASSHESFQTLTHDIKKAFINRSLHDARFRPGSSFKLVTAMAGFEYGRDDLFKAGKLLSSGWFFDKTYSLKETHIGTKKIIVDLENHGQKAMDQLTDFNTALTKSYNVWFSYLGLLLNRNTYGQKFLPGDSYHAFVYPKDRKKDFPLLIQAEKLGFNQKISLYHLTYDDSLTVSPELFLNRNPYVTDDPLTLAASRFPVQTFDQRSIARMAIGQHTVTETPVMNALIALTLSPKWEGQCPSPRLIKSIISADQKQLAFDAGPKVKRVCSPQTAKLIRQAMQKVVIKGTGGLTFRASPFRNKLYGKTGTSERGKPGLFDNSWWTCFVEAPNGKVYTIAACFPDAGEGAHHAADCVKRVLDKMFRYNGW